MYYKHTTRPGKGFKEMNMDRLFRKFGGGEVLRRAVSGMLPKNRLRDVRLDRLKVFEGQAHPYKQNLVTLEATSNRRGPKSATPKALKWSLVNAVSSVTKESFSASETPKAAAV